MNPPESRRDRLPEPRELAEREIKRLARAIAIKRRKYPRSITIIQALKRTVPARARKRPHPSDARVRNGKTPR
jgi:hypothetical protein